MAGVPKKRDLYEDANSSSFFRAEQLRWGLSMKWWLWNGQQAIFFEKLLWTPLGLLRAGGCACKPDTSHRLLSKALSYLCCQESMGRMSLSLWVIETTRMRGRPGLPSWNPSFTVLTRVGCRVILHEDLNSDNCVEMSLIWILHTFQRLIIRGLTHNPIRSWPIILLRSTCFS